jgi:nucleolar protein 12
VTHAPSSSVMYLWKSQRARYARIFFSLGHTPLTNCQSAFKAFKKYVQSQVPEAKIESLRFRSVAFKRSTSAAPAPRTHSLERTAEWREAKGDGVPAPQPRLGSADKKRIAFIKHEFHTDVVTINVYVVFGHGADLPPDEAVKRAIAALDNTQYLDLTLRADTVGGGKSDPRRTVFVGGLDFASREEDVRVFFEGVVCTERGPRITVPGDSDSDDEEDTGHPNVSHAKPKTWVKRVRIVRDKDTQLGKGIAYVQFAVRSSSSHNSSRNPRLTMISTRI